MRTTLLTGLLFALTAGALAQTPQALIETPPAQAAALSSNGPVVLDYGKGGFPDDVEGRIAYLEGFRGSGADYKSKQVIA